MEKIFQMPFDESEGATVTYDYSPNRADGVVNGAHFVPGKNGNAISFDGTATDEVQKNVMALAQAEWSIMAWVMNKEITTGSPKRLVWLLNFGGDNFKEVSIDVTPGSWYNVALTKRNGVFTFYLNSAPIAVVNNNGTLQGVSLNQDYYGGDYGLGCLDDVNIYGVCLSQMDIMNELATTKNHAYYIDGVDLKDYGVYVSGSKGVVNRPKMKKPYSLSWDNYHGEAVDLQHKYFEPREITLQCFIKADNKNDFIDRITKFEAIFDKPGTNRLVIDVHPVKPLIYEVYCTDQIDVDKSWSNSLMVGTFNLKLIEAEPVKRILKHMRTNASNATCEITMDTGLKYVNIYWGDGSVDFDVCLSPGQTVSHTYQENGDYFPVITGDIDKITNFHTNAIIVWNKL